MSSSSNDSQSPPDNGLGWLNNVPDTSPAANAQDGSTAAPIVVVKKSLPPPPAGRGPLHSTTAGIGPHHDAPRAEALSVPELPADLTAQDDPMADFFDGSAQPVVIDGATATEPVRADETPKRPVPGASVAKVGLAKTLIGGPAHEIMSIDAKRDPRADPNTLPPRAAAGEHTIEGLAFDPNHAVARVSDEPEIDATGDVADYSSELSDRPEFAGPPDEVPPAAVRPARSMRSAMMVIGLVLISGAAATAMSLGIIGGPPSRLRTPPTAAAPTAPPTTTVARPVAAPPPVAPTPAAPTPTPVAVVEPTPVAVVEPTPAEPVAAAEPAPVPVEPVAAAEPAPVAASPVVSGDPVAAGDKLLEAGDLNGAAAQYQAALTADSEDHHAMEGIARVHLARGEPQLAIPFAEAIVKRRPKRNSYRELLEQAQRALRR